MQGGDTVPRRTISSPAGYWEIHISDAMPVVFYCKASNGMFLCKLPSLRLGTSLKPVRMRHVSMMHVCKRVWVEGREVQSVVARNTEWAEDKWCFGSHYSTYRSWLITFGNSHRDQWLPQFTVISTPSMLHTCGFFFRLCVEKPYNLRPSK